MSNNMRAPHSIVTTDSALVQALPPAQPCSEQVNPLPRIVCALQPFMRVATYDLSETSGRCGETLDYILPKEGRAIMRIGESEMPTAQDHDFVILLTSHLAHHLALNKSAPPKNLIMCIAEIANYFQKSDINQYTEDIEDSLTRLKDSKVEVSYRIKATETFNNWGPEGFISDFNIITCSRTGKPTAVKIEVPSWMHDLITSSRGKQALPLTPRYFTISSGLGRFLYLIASTNRTSECMFLSREKLHSNSKSPLPVDEFWEYVCNYVTNNSIPDFEIMVTQGKWTPLLAMRRQLDHYLKDIYQYQPSGDINYNIPLTSSR